jgi:hypothetical protein
MESNNKISNEARIIEIERLVSEFQEKFRAGTSQVENFITMSEIEHMWSDLRSRTDNIYSDMLRELLCSVDEGDLIREKKGIQREGGEAED